MKVLLAASDQMIRHVSTKVLRAAGFSVVPVRDGDEAWKEMEQETGPMIAVLDWDLALYDGVSLARTLRSMKFRDYIYVVLLAPRKNKMDELVALESGIDDYLLKPFLVDELLARVNIGRRVIEHERKLSGIIAGYRTMVDTSPFAIACTDEVGVVRRINLPFAQMLGVESPASLLLQSLAEMLSLNREEGNFLLRQVQEQRVMEMVNLHPVWRVSTTAPTCVYGRPVRDDGSNIRYIVTFTCGLQEKEPEPRPPKKENVPELTTAQSA